MSTENNTQNVKPEDFYWQTYLEASKAEDEARPKNWEGSTTGILTFTGLFAATVAAFIVESYKLLSVDSGDQTVALLSQLLAATANASSNTPVVLAPTKAFSAPLSAIITNGLWFSSLLIALICALLSTLVQEWSRNYVQDINRRKVLHESLRERAYNHIYIRMGVNYYGMDQFVSWIVALVHLSVFLFACGLLVFLFPINHLVAGISTVVLGFFIAVYCVASLMPLIDKSCPYRTPISYMMAFVYWLAQVRSRAIELQRRSRSGHPSTHTFRDIITRRYTTKKREFLTGSRFQFAWERTYLHMNYDAPGLFLKSLPSLVRLVCESRPAVISRMCANEDLMGTLYIFLKRSFTRTEPSSSSIYPEVFELVALLSERMYALEVKHHGENLEDGVLTSSYVVHVIGFVSRIAQVDGPSQLSARMCLAHVRASLINLCQKAFEQKMQTLGSEEEVTDFFHEVSDYFFWWGDRHPNAILLLLTAGSYSSYLGRYYWAPTRVPSLLPLHDNDCCRDSRNALYPNGLVHVAACNALTTIAHVLESNDSQRTQTGGLLYQVLYSLDNWDSALPMLPHSERNMISPEFVSVLRAAGLHKWLEPGSRFNTEPARDGPNYEFLSRYPGRYCFITLRALAGQVNFAAHQASTALPATVISTSHTFDMANHTLALPTYPGANSAHNQPDVNSLTANCSVHNRQRDLSSIYTRDVNTILSLSSVTSL